MQKQRLVRFTMLVLCFSLCLFFIVSFMFNESGIAGEKGHSQVLVERAQPVRALHFVTFKLSKQDALNIIDKAKIAGFNTLILGIAWRNSTILNSMPWIEPNVDSWSRDDLVSVVRYASKNGMKVIPNIPLLTHQKVFLKNPFPDLMFNSVTYDPRQERVYEIILPIIDEVIDLLQPEAIHIGHDEVVGWTKRHYERLLKENEKMLPAKLYLADVMRIYSHLKKRDVETWMWGDMLISPKEFSSMRAGALHGSVDGYGKKLRDSLPKDIVITDWHYFDNQINFPSLSVMQKEGFRVIGSTWKKEKTIKYFSRYASKHSAYGMMATTWWPVQSKDWGVVDNIISFSGEAFRKDFPDVE